ncbi:hypothetical protein [Pseudomonas fluorescens]|uniref:hypothetical protein n=1 Tax=Pseudomonas fluorescens TaxID=294 RepID=UPI001781B3FD|nr:hypothetical protein [Pseudomonas fluorescens]
MRLTLFLSINTHPAERFSGNFPPALSTREAAVQKALNIVSYAVLVLMASAVVYASVIGITYWTGIGV